MAKLRITRTLVYEGEEFWVRTSTSTHKTLVGPDKPFTCAAGMIVETSRVEQPLPEAGPDQERSDG